MRFEARIEPLDGKLPKVSYRWDPETDILTVACKGVAKGNGMNGTVDLEGGDGSFVVIDVAGGAMRGVDVVTWPDDVRTVASLAPPEPSKKGQVTFPGRRSQPGVAAVELDTALTVDKNQTESVFHIRVGRQRPATIVRVADHMLVEIDKQSRLAGLWLLEVPPFPNVEATAEWTRDSSATSPSCSPLKIRFSPKSARVTRPNTCRRSTSRPKKASCSICCC